MSRVFQLTGIGLIVLGTWLQMAKRLYINLLGDDLLAAPGLIITTGVLIAILGFFGCCGAIRENYCMTMTVRYSHPLSLSLFSFF